uniref:UBX domain-containing protein n=1 Tax=Rhabditophanes sp. KR3021 TaxID=114890 RepID=A0AC35U3X8_9BILA
MDDILSKLNRVQKDALDRYQEIMSISDRMEAYDIMVASDWDLEKALSKDFDFIRHNRGSNGTDNDSAGSSSGIARPTITTTAAEPFRGVLPPTINPNEVIVINDNDMEEDENDEDDEETYYDDDDDVMIIDESPDLGANGIPLIPCEFNCVEEALQNFITVFEARYDCSPPFSQWPLPDIVREALDAPYPNIVERRPILIYIHHDRSLSANIFPVRVFKNPAIMDIIKHRFVLWPWDITSNDNKKILLDLFKKMNIPSDFILGNRLNELPVMVTLLKKKGSFSVISAISCTDSTENMVGKLNTSLEVFDSIKSFDMETYLERKERAATLNEQNKGYQESLAKDKAKKEESERAAKLQRLEDEKEERLKNQRDQIISHSASLVPAEPTDKEPNTVTIKIRFPGGKTSVRRFYKSNCIGDFVNYISSLGYPSSEFDLFNSEVPKQNVNKMKRHETFEDANWPIRENIIVEEI